MDKEATHFESTVKKLKSALSSLRRANFECGKIIFEYHQSAPPTKKDAAIQALAEAVGISAKTARNYMNLYQRTKTLDTNLIEQAHKAGINIESEQQVRVLQETKHNMSSATPDEVIARTKEKIQKKAENRKRPSVTVTENPGPPKFPIPNARNADWTPDDMVRYILAYAASVVRPLPKTEQVKVIEQALRRVLDDVQFDSEEAA